jgi:hypothetical protein
MASFGNYKNNNLQTYTENFINKEFLPDNRINSSQIERVVDYRRNTENDKHGAVEFYIDTFICTIQTNNLEQAYYLYHYWGEFHYRHDYKFNFEFCKLVKFPFTNVGKNQMDIYFSKIESEYGNNEYFF